MSETNSSIDRHRARCARLIDTIAQGKAEGQDVSSYEQELSRRQAELADEIAGIAPPRENTERI